MAEPLKSERANLEDVLNYKPEEYFDADDLNLIRSTFKDTRVLKVLRKIFLPTIADPDMPLEQMGNDMWFAHRNWDQIPNEEAKSLIVARQEAIKYIMNALVRLKIMAHSKPEDPIEEAYRRSKDSAK